MLEGLRTARGVARSLRIYYGDRQRRMAMGRLYAKFMRPGDLVFDVGAHVGDRVAAFRRLGCRVVAVEPQPALVRTLSLLYGRDPDIHIEAVAVGRTDGTATLRLNLDNPTVSTASTELIRASATAPTWRGQVWSRSITVPTTTLDALVARYGRPSFIKIDVEGFEAEALAGLSQPPAALSFEFTTIQRKVAGDALSRCEALGYERFNAALGESQILIQPDWVSARTMRDWLMALPASANSGDIYAALA